MNGMTWVVTESYFSTGLLGYSVPRNSWVSSAVLSVHVRAALLYLILVKVHS